MRFTRTPAGLLRAQRTPIAAALLAATLACSCAPVAAPPVPAASPPAAGSLRVRLVFDDDADLDLYVTGPQQETVYFANNPSKIGGELERDLRCDAAPGVREETIRFAAAPPGRYRVGVDFAERCRLPARPVAFAVAVDGAGLHERRAGVIELGVFQPVVFEFELGGAGAASRSAGDP